MPLEVMIAATDAPEGVMQWFREWANVKTTFELWWVLFGVLAQSLFFCRWIVQWLASEKRGESHVPDLFWWLSLSGATMVFIYFLVRGEPVGMLGQSVGWAVYSRNLYLIRKKRRSQAGGGE